MNKNIIPEKKNKRVHKRVPLNLLVQFKSENYEHFLEEYAPNISSGGMFIQSKQPRPLGSTVFFQFSLESGGPLIEGMAKVVHVNNDRDGDKVAGMGLEFMSLDAASSEQISKLIESRQ